GPTFIHRRLTDRSGALLLQIDGKTVPLPMTRIESVYELPPQAPGDTNFFTGGTPQMRLAIRVWLTPEQASTGNIMITGMVDAAGRPISLEMVPDNAVP